MPEETTLTRHTLGVEGARQLAVVTKTVPNSHERTADSAAHDCHCSAAHVSNPPRATQFKPSGSNIR